MQRRKFLVGMGSLAAGGAATMSTGALTEGSMDRDIQVQVSGDPNGYVSLYPGNGANGSDFASTSELAVDFQTSSGGGTGVNEDSHSRFDDVFRIANKGNQKLYAYVTINGNGFGTNVLFYDTKDPDKIPSDASFTSAPSSASNRNNSPLINLNDLDRAAAALSVGQGVSIGIDIDTGDAANGIKLGDDDDLRVVVEDDPSDLPSIFGNSGSTAYNASLP